jgi:hypothetical protein
MDEMEDIFFNMPGNDATGSASNEYRDAVYQPPPTITLPVAHDEQSPIYPGTPPYPCSSGSSYSTGTFISAPPSPSLAGFEGT